MKKFLLSLAAVAMGFSMASAAEVTLTMANLSPLPDGSQETVTSTVDGYSLVIEKADANNIPTVNGTQKDLRIYAGGKITITAPQGVTMTAIDFTISTQGKKRLGPVTASVGTVSQDQGVTTWAGSANSVAFTATAGGRSDYGTDDNKAAQFDFTAIVVTYTGTATGEPDTPVTPDEPDTPAETTHYASFAAFQAAGAGSKGILDGPVSVCYQGGAYLFIKDAVGGYGMIYGSTSEAYTNGQQFAQVEGTMDIYNGTPEIKDAVLPAATAGAAVEPDVVGLDEISAEMVNTYVKLEGVSIVANGTGFDVTDGTTTMTLYKRFNDCVPAAAENVNIIGFVGMYKTTVQIYPAEITTAGGVEVKVCASPYFSQLGGAVDAGYELTLTCATEGSSIFYTLDGTEPTSASTEYTAPIVINEACTVKAIAYAEGYEPSAVRSADFTIKVVDPDAKTATLDFTDVNSFSPALPMPVLEGTSTSAGADLVADTEYASNGFKFSVPACEGNALPRVWLKSNGSTEFRAYQNQSFTISATGTALIKGLEFAGSKVATDYLSIDGANVKDGAWTAAAPVASVTVNVLKTINCTGITVSYEGTTSGVESIEAEAETAPAVYYNLQGVRVANPAAGQLLIKVQGKKATKVLVK